MKGDGVTTQENTRRSFQPVNGARDWWQHAPMWQRYLVYIALIVFALILPAPWIGSFMSPASDWTSVLIFPIGTYIPHPSPIFGMEFLLDPAPYYYLILVAIVLVIVFSVRLQKSRVGRAWAAIREDEDAAELMGVPTFKFKLLAFAIGAMIGGFAGGMYAGKAIFISPLDFPFILSATILAAVV